MVDLALTALKAIRAVSAATVVLIGSDLRRLGTCVRLSRQCRRTLQVNVVIGLGWTFVPQKLAPVPAFAGQLPPASPPEGMSLSALPTGLMKSQAGFAWRGGSLLDQLDNQAWLPCRSVRR